MSLSWFWWHFMRTALSNFLNIFSKFAKNCKGSTTRDVHPAAQEPITLIILCVLFLWVKNKPLNSFRNVNALRKNLFRNVPKTLFLPPSFSAFVLPSDAWRPECAQGLASFKTKLKTSLFTGAFGLLCELKHSVWCVYKSASSVSFLLFKAVSKESGKKIHKARLDVSPYAYVTQVTYLQHTWHSGGRKSAENNEACQLPSHSKQTFAVTVRQ